MCLYDIDQDTHRRLPEAAADARARMQPVETDEPVAMSLGDALNELVTMRFGRALDPKTEGAD